MTHEYLQMYGRGSRPNYEEYGARPAMEPDFVLNGCIDYDKPFDFSDPKLFDKVSADIQSGIGLDLLNFRLRLFEDWRAACIRTDVDFRCIKNRNRHPLDKFMPWDMPTKNKFEEVLKDVFGVSGVAFHQVIDGSLTIDVFVFPLYYENAVMRARVQSEAEDIVAIIKPIGTSIHVRVCNSYMPSVFIPSFHPFAK